MDMKERLCKAKRGREVWLSLCDSYNISGSSYVLIFPDRDFGYNEQALGHLQEFIEKKGISEIFLLADDGWLAACEVKLPAEAKVVRLESEKIDEILQFYCLYDFAPNLIVASLEKPSGRLGRGLIGKRGISAEEVFVKEIYGMNLG